MKSDAIPLFIPPGTSIQLSRQKRNSFGRFQAVGEFSTTEKEAKYDLLEAITKLSKGAQLLFIEMIRHRDDANRIVLPRTCKIGTAKYKVRMRHSAQIKAHNLIAYVYKDTTSLLSLEEQSTDEVCLFILNPHFIKCPKQLDAQLYWNAVTRRA